MHTSLNHAYARFLVPALLALAAAPAGALPLATDRPAADIDFRAYWSLEFNRPDLAVPLYGSLIGVFPDYQDRPWAMFHLLRGYLDTDRFDDLYSLADQILAEYPDTPVAAWSQLVRGNAYRRQGDKVRASEMYKAVCRQAASLEDLNPVVGACTRQGELFGNAAQERLANPSPETPIPKSTPERESAAKAIYQPARAVLTRQASAEETATAVEELRRLIADYGDTSYVPWARFRIAHGQLNLGRPEEAMVAAQAVIADYPGTIPAAWSQLLIGEAYRSLGQLLNAYDAFRDVEAYDQLADPKPAISARIQTRQIWDALCQEHPEVKDADWPTPGRDISVANLAALNEYDPNEKGDCAWIGTCWVACIDPPLTLGLFDEIAEKYPDQSLWVALAAIIAGERFLLWADSRPGTLGRTAEKQRAVELLESVRTIVPDKPPFHVQADLALAKRFQRDSEWAAVVAVAERALSEVPGAYCENEMACILGDACIHLGRYDDAIAASAVVTGKTKHSAWMWPAMHCKGVALARQGKLAEATRQFRDLVEVSSSPPWRILAAEEAAKYSLEAGDRPGAIEALQIAAAEIREELATGRVHVQKDWSVHAKRRLAKVEARLAALQAEGE